MQLVKELKNRLMFLLAKTVLRPVKLTSEQIKNATVLSLKQEDLRIINDTTNNVFEFELDGSKCYFRPCRKHYEIHEYVALLIKEFCHGIDDQGDFYNAVTDSLKQKRRFKRFVNMGFENDSSSPLANFQTTHNAELVGLPQELYDKYPDNVYKLTQYAWGEIVSYKFNGAVGKNQYHTYNSNRSIATYVLAATLNMERLVPRVEYCHLHFSDSKEKYFGTLMRSAIGISPEKIEPDNIRDMISPILQRELSDLNLLDILCYQKDHRPGNYYIQVQNDKFTNVSAFDNDAPSTFTFSNSIDYTTYIGCSPIVCTDGTLNRPYVSRSVYNKLLTVDIKDIRAKLKPYVNKSQFSGFKRRLKKLRAVLKKTADARPNFLLENEEWSEETVCEELSGLYGTTYLAALLKNNWRVDK